MHIDTHPRSIQHHLGAALRGVEHAVGTVWRTRRSLAQSMVEYAIVAALVAVVAVAAVKALGGTVSNAFQHVCSEVQTADNASNNAGGGGGGGNGCNTPP